ncbi:MAG: hypothetical protein IH602_00755 [Bryobacteraceae bacterium]|nr:hypothetical protein [Bryobacteraceae bacterium]
MRITTSRQDDKTYWWLLALAAAIIFEGAARRWILPAALQPLAYISKDLIALAFLYANRNRKYLPAPNILKVYCGILGVMLIIPFVRGLENHPIAAIITAKNALLWPLVAYRLSRVLVPNDYTRLVTPWISILALQAVLGIIQYYSPQSSYVNKLAWDTPGLNIHSVTPTFGGNYGTRATGTFSFISGYTQFAMYSALYFLYLLLYHRIACGRTKVVAGLFLAIVCGVASGARVFVAWLVVAFTVNALIGIKARALATTLVIFSCGAGVIYIGLSGVDDNIFSALLNRWRTSSDTTIERVTGTNIRGNFYEIVARQPLGAGLGSTHGLTARDRMAEGDPRNIAYDDGGTNAIVESGLFGLFVLLTNIYLFAHFLHLSIFKLNKPFGQAGFVFGLLHLYAFCSVMWYDHVGTAIKCLCLGMWLGLWRYNSTERLAVKNDFRENVIRRKAHERILQRR